MDIPRVLANIRSGQDWGPCAQSDSTYAQFAAGWNLRHGNELPANPPPTQAAMDAEWTNIVNGQAASDYAALKAAAHAVLNDTTDKLRRLLYAEALVIMDELNILREQVVGTATAVWNPASMANGAGVTSPAVAVTGAAFGDFVLVSAPYTLAGITATGFVSSAGNVMVRLENQTGSAVDLASGTWKVAVLRLNNLADRTPSQIKTAIGNKIDSTDAD